MTAGQSAGGFVFTPRLFEKAWFRAAWFYFYGAYAKLHDTLERFGPSTHNGAPSQGILGALGDVSPRC